MNDYRPPGFQLIPTVIKNLLIINILFMLAGMRFGEVMDNYFSLHRISSDLFMPHQFVTHMFMHANNSHLFFNMFALWMFGSLLERRWGPKRFLVFYMICGIGASFIHMTIQEIDMWNMENLVFGIEQGNIRDLDDFIASYIPEHKQGAWINLLQKWSVDPANSELAEIASTQSKLFMLSLADRAMLGASGAIFGILLAFGMSYPNVLMFPIPIKAKYFVIFYGIAELIAGISNNPSDNVAHFAHLGGMLFGYILIRFWRTRGIY